MQAWLISKMDHITQEFLAGGGYPWAYEAQFIAYLECWVVIRRGEEAAASLWADFHKLCLETDPPTSLGGRNVTRKEMVAALRQLQRRFEGPQPKSFKIPPPAKAAQPLSLSDFLSGPEK